MSRHVLLRSWVLLVTLFVAACGPPDAVTPPTPPPVAAPTTTAVPATVAISPTTLPPTAAAIGIEPQAQIEATQTALCQPPGSSNLYICADLLPTPNVPFAQALRQFTGRTLLYSRAPTSLMFGDPDSGASMWLNRAFCPPRITVVVQAAWSADGQFIAVSCQDGHSWMVDLLDMQTANVRQIAAGDVVNFAWSPTGHHLLVTGQKAARQHAFVMDAATGVTAELPFAPLWEQHNGPAPWPVGQEVEARMDSTAAMAWSPDGMQIAVIGECMCLVDADMAHAHDGRLVVLMPFGGGGIQRPRWSHDAYFLFTAMTHENNSNPLSPSSRFSVITLRTEISTGVITSTYPIEPLWSPDEQAYLMRNPAPEAGVEIWSLHQADGTRTRVITDAVAYGPYWTPDSQQALFVFPHDLGLRIVAVDLAGREHTLLTTNESLSFDNQNSSPISPDGELFAATTNSAHTFIAVYDFQGDRRVLFEGEQILGWRAAP